ncbi:transport-related membrane protein [Burkholderia sp. SFA1]|uniref:FTR1 family iron permease n=1 Tax=unclassified Caballeronia TaxID=2646786 RepID=UPI001F283D84|nr:MULTISPECIES: FTR1 family protein [unclassified Caballeronia]MCE4544870.1 FTR1 family protein [Caballeronia sp. PC1]MCE4570295.1 FTR1 family protein [Caballeronia sp. CLC5]BBP98133.1 transport-related membrane protein [Burkholderia sp. SFA1]
MLSTALIVFREVLEASLIVSIVLAASKGVPGRGWWVAGGLLGGIVGAGLLAVFADALSNLASGLGQEFFNAAIMIVAVVMLAWHSIWMSSHSREMARQISAVGKAVASGSKPLIGLSIVVGAAVLREGAEAVLFLYGVLVSSPGETLQMVIGGALGLVGGVSLGIGMYAGLLQIPIKKLFAVTNALIVLLAAGMASQCVGFLISAGAAPTWGDVVWDSSWLLEETSIVGKMLHALVGYTARPAGSQIVAYFLTCCVIVGLSRFASNRQKTLQTGGPARR